MLLGGVTVELDRYRPGEFWSLAKSSQKRLSTFRAARQALSVLVLMAMPLHAQRASLARTAVSRIEQQRPPSPAVQMRFDDDTSGHTCAMVCSVVVGTAVGAVAGAATGARQVSKTEDAFFGEIAVEISAVIGALLGALTGAGIDIIRSHF